MGGRSSEVGGERGYVSNILLDLIAALSWFLAIGIGVCVTSLIWSTAGYGIVGLGYGLATAFFLVQLFFFLSLGIAERIALRGVGRLLPVVVGLRRRSLRFCGHFLTWTSLRGIYLALAGVGSLASSVIVCGRLDADIVAGLSIGENVFIDLGVRLQNFDDERCKLDPIQVGPGAVLHPRCIIEPGARIGGGASIGPCAIIGRRATIAAGAVVPPRYVVEEDEAFEGLASHDAGSQELWAEGGSIA